MSPRSTTIAALGLAALLAAPLPRVLEGRVDDVRFRLATLFARPFHALAAPAAPAPDAGALAAREAAWRALDRERAGADEIVPVIARAGAHAVILGAGWEGGVEVGQSVVVEGVFSGLVDRVERHLARVRLTSDPDLRYGASIRGVDAADRSHVLLRGGEDGAARPQLGRGLDLDAVGALAWRGPDSDLVVGVVELPADEPRPVVRLFDPVRRRDRVALLDGRDRTAVPVEPAVLFARRVGRVVATGDARLGDASLMIDLGRRDGLAEGDVVSAAGVVVGRVSRCGDTAARVRIDPGAIAALADEGADGPRRFSRGREERAAPAPAGLAITSDAAPAAGTAVEAHVFLHRDELARLRRGTGR